MNIMQRKLLSGYNRAFASDHRRDKHAEQRADNLWLAVVLGACAFGVIMKVAGLA